MSGIRIVNQERKGGETTKILSKDRTAAITTGALVGVMVFVLVAAMIFPLINAQVADLTNESSENYVGEDTVGLVQMIPLFYWLVVALTVISFAVVAIKDTV